MYTGLYHESNLNDLTSIPAETANLSVYDCKNFKSLNGLERCKNIKSIEIAFCPITDISALENNCYALLKTLEFGSTDVRFSHIYLERHSNLERFRLDEFIDYSNEIKVDLKLPNSMKKLELKNVLIQAIDF